MPPFEDVEIAFWEFEESEGVATHQGYFEAGWNAALEAQND